jgi:hypothetical protein
MHTHPRLYPGSDVSHLRLSATDLLRHAPPTSAVRSNRTSLVSQVVISISDSPPPRLPALTSLSNPSVPPAASRLLARELSLPGNQALPLVHAPPIMNTSVPHSASSSSLQQPSVQPSVSHLPSDPGHLPPVRPSTSPAPTNYYPLFDSVPHKRPP